MKTNQLMSYRKIITAYPEIYKNPEKHSGQKEKVLNIKAGST
jgi:hypothetical protein